MTNERDTRFAVESEILHRLGASGGEQGRRVAWMGLEAGTVEQVENELIERCGSDVASWDGDLGRWVSAHCADEDADRLWVRNMVCRTGLLNNPWVRDERLDTWESTSDVGTRGALWARRQQRARTLTTSLLIALSNGADRGVVMRTAVDLARSLGDDLTIDDDALERALGALVRLGDHEVLGVAARESIGEAVRESIGWDRRAARAGVRDTRQKRTMSILGALSHRWGENGGVGECAAWVLGRVADLDEREVETLMRGLYAVAEREPVGSPWNALLELIPLSMAEEVSEACTSVERIEGLLAWAGDSGALDAVVLDVARNATIGRDLADRLMLAGQHGAGAEYAVSGVRVRGAGDEARLYADPSWIGRLDEEARRHLGERAALFTGDAELARALLWEVEGAAASVWAAGDDSLIRRELEGLLDERFGEDREVAISLLSGRGSLREVRSVIDRLNVDVRGSGRYPE